MTSEANEVQRDIDELKRLLQLATRKNVQTLLQGHLNGFQEKFDSMKIEVAVQTPEAPAVVKPTVTAPAATPIYKKLTTYAWDQSEKFVKVYATSLANVGKLAKENITCDFTNSGFNLLVRDLNGKSYQLSIPCLYEEVNAESSSIKVKADSVLVMLRKSKPGDWSGLTQVDKKKKERQKLEDMPKNSDDPQASIMNLMKKMYDEGDDEMKRTINKAWSESQEKKASGDLGL